MYLTKLERQSQLPKHSTYTASASGVRARSYPINLVSLEIMLKTMFKVDEQNAKQQILRVIL